MMHQLQQKQFQDELKRQENGRRESESRAYSVAWQQCFAYSSNPADNQITACNEALSFTVATADERRRLTVRRDSLMEMRRQTFEQNQRAAQEQTTRRLAAEEATRQAEARAQAAERAARQSEARRKDAEAAERSKVSPLTTGGVFAGAIVLALLGLAKSHMPPGWKVIGGVLTGFVEALLLLQFGVEKGFTVYELALLQLPFGFLLVASFKIKGPIMGSSYS